jgi:hypothetical protein
MIDNISYHNNTNYPSVKPYTVMIDNIAYHNKTNYPSVKPYNIRGVSFVLFCLRLVGY